MRIGVIVNPVAGRGSSIEKWQAMRAVLVEEKVSFTEFYTQVKGEAESIARHCYRSGFSHLLVAGGDGTLHEVVNGLEVDLQPTLGLLPTGTGNDFSRALGIHYDQGLALRLIKNPGKRVVDLGTVNGKRFVNMAGIGFDAQIAWEVNQGLRFVSGKAAYLVSLCKVLMVYRAPFVRITLDEKPPFEEEILLLAIANAPYVGGGMKMVPTAIPDDGWFHICLVKMVNRLEVLKTLPKIYRGTHIEHPSVQILSAKKIRIESTSNVFMHTDGESAEGLPAVFEVVPSSMVFLTGKE